MARRVHQILYPIRQMLLAGALLAVVIYAIFRPILGFELVDFDVFTEVIDNQHVHGMTAENVRHILTRPCTTSYYPVRTLSFAANYQFWGLNPTAFKLTNGLIHLANVYLVFWLVLRLFRHGSHIVNRRRRPWDSFVAAISAGVFAVHPVVVEPVTWICGREELLMTFWALACFHFHLTARRLGEGAGTRRAVACHVATALCCLFACLSNAVAAVLPLLIAVWDLLMLSGPKRRRIFGGTAALWAITVATILVKRAGDDSDVSGIPVLFSIDGIMVVLNVYWLDLKTLVWPTNLAMHYDWPLPRGYRPLGAALGGIAAVLTGLLVWILRRKKLALFGILWFVIVLGPTLHLLVHHIYRADRYLYLPLIGLVLALAMGLRSLEHALLRFSARAGTVVAWILAWAVAACVLLPLGLRSADQVWAWENSIVAWENCVRVYPLNVKAHAALGRNLHNAGQSHRGIVHVRTALELDPRDYESLMLFLTLTTEGPEDLRDYDMAVRMALRFLEATNEAEPYVYHAISVVFSNYALGLANMGNPGGAVEFYSQSIQWDAEYEAPLFNLALLLVNCDDPRWRNPPEAVRLAERACRLTKHQDPNGLMILAIAYGESDRLEEAIATAAQAADLARSAGNAELTDQIESQLQLYRDRISAPSEAP